MIKNMFIAILTITLFTIVLFIFKERACSSQEQMSISPIFSKNETFLRCIRCTGEEESYESSERLFKDIGKELKSKKSMYITEIWTGEKKVIHIDRWYFEFPEDASYYPGSGIILLAQGFPGWKDKSNPQIGDKTCWLTPYCVYFTKGKVLVRVSDTSKAFDKNFLIEIAKNIAKKL